jgi:hypothetical protein
MMHIAQYTRQKEKIEKFNQFMTMTRNGENLIPIEKISFRTGITAKEDVPEFLLYEINKILGTEMETILVRARTKMESDLKDMAALAIDEYKELLEDAGLSV